MTARRASGSAARMRARAVLAVACAVSALCAWPPVAGAEPAAVAGAGAGEAKEYAPQTQRLLLEIDRRARELDDRESMLVQRERALAELEAELAARLAEWDRLRVGIERRIDELKEGMGDRVAALSKTYGSMPPERAADLVRALEPDLATAVVTRMKSKQAAKVLAALPRDRAKDLSQRMVTPLVLDDVEEAADAAPSNAPPVGAPAPASKEGSKP
ncbi:MAG: hypothetical protein R3E88_18170 [Myxococcota bacterium]